MRLGFSFGPVFDLICLLVNINPIQLWWIVRDSGNQALAFPAPLMIRMREKISSKSMSRRFLEFELFVCGQVDVQLDSDCVSNSNADFNHDGEVIRTDKPCFGAKPLRRHQSSNHAMIFWGRIQSDWIFDRDVSLSRCFFVPGERLR